MGGNGGRGGCVGAEGFGAGLGAGLGTGLGIGIGLGAGFMGSSIPLTSDAKSKSPEKPFFPLSLLSAMGNDPFRSIQ